MDDREELLKALERALEHIEQISKKGLTVSTGVIKAAADVYGRLNQLKSESDQT